MNKNWIKEAISIMLSFAIIASGTTTLYAVDGDEIIDAAQGAGNTVGVPTVGLPPTIGGAVSGGMSVLSYLDFTNKVIKLQKDTFGTVSTSSPDITLNDALREWKQVCIELNLTDMKIYQLLDSVASTSQSISNGYNKAKYSLSSVLNTVLGNKTAIDYQEKSLSEEEIKKMYERYLENMQKDEEERLRIEAEREERLRLESIRIEKEIESNPNILRPGETVELDILGPTTIDAINYESMSLPIYVDVMYINSQGAVTNIVDDADDGTNIYAYQGKIIIKNESLINIELVPYVGYSQNWIAHNDNSRFIEAKVIKPDELLKITNNTENTSVALLNYADSYIHEYYKDSFSPEQRITYERRIWIGSGESIYLKGNSSILYDSTLSYEFISTID